MSLRALPRSRVWKRRMHLDYVSQLAFVFRVYLLEYTPPRQ